MMTGSEVGEREGDGNEKDGRTKTQTQDAQRQLCYTVCRCTAHAAISTDRS